MDAMEQITAALSALRTPLCPGEYDLHALAAQALSEAGIPFEHEKKLGPRSRIDLYSMGIGIEIKRGRPTPARLIPQLKKYAQSPEIMGLILLVERNADIPPVIGGKQVKLISLNRLWGIAL